MNFVKKETLCRKQYRQQLNTYAIIKKLYIKTRNRNIFQIFVVLLKIVSPMQGKGDIKRERVIKGKTKQETIRGFQCTFENKFFIIYLPPFPLIPPLVPEGALSSTAHQMASDWKVTARQSSAPLHPGTRRVVTPHASWRTRTLTEVAPLISSLPHQASNCAGSASSEIAAPTCRRQHQHRIPLFIAYCVHTNNRYTHLPVYFP